MSNFGIIHDSKGESSHEDDDRIWRRWSNFCTNFLALPDPHLNGVQTDESILIFRVFFTLYRESNFDHISGAITGRRKKQMAGTTIRKAAISLAASFRNRIGRSPLHQRHKKDSEFWNDLRLLFRAMDNTSPNTKQQKAVTPQLLRAMVHSSSEEVINDPQDHATDLVVGGYFFAMRSCEFAKAAKQGRTKMICLGGIKF